MIAQLGFHDPGDLDQHLVADLMAVVVVDAFEVIDVQQCQAQRPCIAPGPLAFLAQPFGEQATVGDAGQGIVCRGFLQRDVQVAHHALVAIGNACDLFQPVQLLLEARGHAQLALAGNALIAVGQPRDTLDTLEQVAVRTPQASQGIVQSMRLVLRFGQQFGDFLLKGLRPAHQTALSLGSESRRERCSLP